MELCFWMTVDWESLWSPMGYDILLAGSADSVKSAEVGVWDSNVYFVAADTSNLATGGGKFEPMGSGQFNCLQFAHHMLRHGVRDASSALREIEGIASTLLAVDLPKGARVIVVTDNQAVWRELDKGSSKPELRKVARSIFLYCVRRGIVLQPVWLPRTSQLIKFCDEGSRITDNCDYSAGAGLFWGSNDIAKRLWGRGFTHDRFASARQ